ncbi:MAG: outer membrane beta-barrel protein [Azospirillaceae bacterium]|nr:outer membrane beta-barrel protein [Azospirillaceae bacterium]
MPTRRLHRIAAAGLSIATLVGGLAAPARAQLLSPSAPTEDANGHQSSAKVTQDLSTSGADPGNGANDVADSYQPKGIEYGEFLIFPKVELNETYNSNVYATPSDVKGDFITTIQPQIDLRSRFAEHELDFSFLAKEQVFATYTLNNTLDLSATVNGRYDITREAQATYYGQVFSGHEDRGSPDDAHGREPTPTTGSINQFEVKDQLGRVTIGGGVALNRYEFGNVDTTVGTTVDNSDRNRWELSSHQRVSYELFPGYAAVADISENTHVFDVSSDRNGFNRNSSGYAAQTGVAVDVSQLVRGDFLVGYFAQDYRDSRLRSPSGVSASAVFNWTPSKLTLIVPALQRSSSDTTIDGAGALVETLGSLTVRHELQRNIILTGYTSVAYDQYSGYSAQNATTYTARARLIYAFTPELYAGGELSYVDKVSRTLSVGYQQTTAMLKLGLQY